MYKAANFLVDILKWIRDEYLAGRISGSFGEGFIEVKHSIVGEIHVNTSRLNDPRLLHTPK